MHIAILSDPNNFHTRKWAKALERQGSEVTVFSFETNEFPEINAVQIEPAMAPGGNYTYLSYLRSGKRLATALDSAKIDVVNALNVTPFGVWGKNSKVRPLIASCMGADILEFPPGKHARKKILDRSWANPEGGMGLNRIKAGILSSRYKAQVKSTLEYADLITGDNRELVDKVKNWFGISGDKVKLLRWGVEPDLFDPPEELVDRMRKRFGLGPQQKLILSPRGAKAIYQADIILDGFKALLKQGYRGHQFVMLGAGYEVSSKVRDAAKAMELEFGNFHFVEETLGTSEMHALWKLTEVFVSAPIYDGYSASVAEGRYAGAIPVVNGIPANREVIRHRKNGWIVGSFDANGLSRAIIEVLDKGEDWKTELKRQNKRWIEKNSLVDANARLFLQWCEKLA